MLGSGISYQSTKKDALRSIKPFYKKKKVWYVSYDKKKKTKGHFFTSSLQSEKKTNGKGITESIKLGKVTRVLK